MKRQMDDPDRRPSELSHPRIRLPRGADETLFGGWGVKL